MAAELEDRRPSTSDPDESDGEDSASLSLSLSLCDVALDGHDGSDGTVSSDDGQLSPPPPPTETFEFFSGDLSAAEDMCSADDVFHQGQLLPYKHPPPQPSPAKTSDAPASKIAPFDHRRSESLDGINRSRDVARVAAKYRRLRRAVSDSDPRTHLLPPPTQPPATPRSRPKWYLVVFGPVRVPVAMEMKDIRNRQRRRRSPSVAEGGGLGFKVGSRPWKLLQSLSCKGAESAVVSPPLSFVSHVRG